MSVADLPDRPAFHSMEPELDEMQTAPTSRLAIIACVLGVLSLSAILSALLLPLAVIGITCGTVALWQASRSGSASSTRLAQVGLGLAILATTWSIAAGRTRNAYLLDVATPHAQAYLKLIGEGEFFRAYELTKAEVSRQISGTDLEAYYNNLEDAMAKDMAMTFASAEHIREVHARGPNAQWELNRGEVSTFGQSMRITVVMQEREHPDKRKISVVLAREPAPSEESPDAYSWYVSGTSIVKE